MTAEILEDISCCCFLSEGALTEAAAYFSARRPTSVMIVSDETVFSLYGERWSNSFPFLKVFHALIPTGESGKTIETVAALWSKMRQMGMDRHSCVLALGGGLVTDVAGFAAATYMRGVSLVNVPTTLLGMVDAAIGGKNGVDFEGMKNLVGTFYQPDRIFIDSHFLQTLSREEYRSGLAEMIKYGEAVDAELFEIMKRELMVLFDPEKLLPLIHRCCRLKEMIVAEDEKDYGRRTLLNFGHTFAHALESLSDWELPHGEAVSIGISCAWHLSSAMRLADPNLIREHDTLCQKLGLPTALPEVDIDKMCERMRQDKKATAESFSFVLAKDIGEAFKKEGVSCSVVKRALLKKLSEDRK